jgi:hypothetical protein
MSAVVATPRRDTDGIAATASGCCRDGRG